MEKESTGGQWRLADGSDVPASFEYEWRAGRRGLPNIHSSATYDFMLVYCGSGSDDFGRLINYPNNNNNFICQGQ